MKVASIRLLLESVNIRRRLPVMKGDKAEAVMNCPLSEEGF